MKSWSITPLHSLITYKKVGKEQDRVVFFYWSLALFPVYEINQQLKKSQVERDIK